MGKSYSNTFRFLNVPLDFGEGSPVEIVSQDQRRSRNVVTGLSRVQTHTDGILSMAKQYGCVVIIRPKRRT